MNLVCHHVRVAAIHNLNHTFTQGLSSTFPGNRVAIKQLNQLLTTVQKLVAGQALRKRPN